MQVNKAFRKYNKINENKSVKSLKIKITQKNYLNYIE